MRIFQGDRIAMIMSRLGVDENMPIQNRSVSKTLEAAQKRIEGFNFDSRKNVVQYDNVINRHRKVVYGMRRKILDGADIQDEINRLIDTCVADLVKDSARVNPNFAQEFAAVFPLDSDLIEGIGEMRKEKDRERTALAAVRTKYAEKEAEFGPEIMRKIEREVYLRVLDTLWMQHLENMQHLREGIHWRSLGQRDPLVEYRSESQNLFNNLEKNLREEVLKILLSLTKQEATSEGVTDGEEYDTELTKMAEAATEKGVNEISAGEKNLDREFSDQPAAKTNTSENHARNQARKHKKQQRQNKKKGKRR